MTASHSNQESTPLGGWIKARMDEALDVEREIEKALIACPNIGTQRVATAFGVHFNRVQRIRIRLELDGTIPMQPRDERGNRIADADAVLPPLPPREKVKESLRHVTRTKAQNTAVDLEIEQRLIARPTTGSQKLAEEFSVHFARVQKIRARLEKDGIIPEQPRRSDGRRISIGDRGRPDEEVEEFLREHPNMSNREIGRQLHVSTVRVKELRFKYNIYPTVPSATTLQDRIVSNLTNKAVAVELAADQLEATWTPDCVNPHIAKQALHDLNHMMKSLRKVKNLLKEAQK